MLIVAVFLVCNTMKYYLLIMFWPVESSNIRLLVDIFQIILNYLYFIVDIKISHAILKQC